MNLVKFLNGYGVKKQACKVVCRLVGSLTFKGQATLVNDYSDDDPMITNKRFLELELVK